MEHTDPGAKQPKFVRWALMLGIVVVLNVFFSVIVSLAFPYPQYNDYCPSPTGPTPTDAATCDAQGGTWTETSVAPPTSDVKAPSGYCDMYAKCQKPFQNALDQAALSSFILMIVLGVVSLVGGLLPIGSSIVSSGLSYGGVLALIVASVSYWGSAGQWLRLGIATVALLGLLYVGIRKFRD